MDVEKIKRLEDELDKYEKKLKEMQVNWSATKGGSRYGDEYLETQIKVYQSMIAEVKREIMKLKVKN
jgi:hypothetical protein